MLIQWNILMSIACLTPFSVVGIPRRYHRHPTIDKFTTTDDENDENAWPRGRYSKVVYDSKPQVIGQRSPVMLPNAYSGIQSAPLNSISLVSHPLDSRSYSNLDLHPVAPIPAPLPSSHISPMLHSTAAIQDFSSPSIFHTGSHVYNRNPFGTPGSKYENLGTLLRALIPRWRKERALREQLTTSMRSSLYPNYSPSYNYDQSYYGRPRDTTTPLNSTLKAMHLLHQMRSQNLQNPISYTHGGPWDPVARSHSYLGPQMIPEFQRLQEAMRNPVVIDYNLLPFKGISPIADYDLPLSMRSMSNRMASHAQNSLETAKILQKLREAIVGESPLGSSLSGLTAGGWPNGYHNIPQYASQYPLNHISHSPYDIQGSHSQALLNPLSHRSPMDFHEQSLHYQSPYEFGTKMGYNPRSPLSDNHGPHGLYPESLSQTPLGLDFRGLSGHGQSYGGLGPSWNPNNRPPSKYPFFGDSTHPDHSPVGFSQSPVGQHGTGPIWLGGKRELRDEPKTDLGPGKPIPGIWFGKVRTPWVNGVGHSYHGFGILR